MNGLTTVAALPSGGGCLSALPSEVAPTPSNPGELKVQMKASYFEWPELEWPQIVFLGEEPEC